MTFGFRASAELHGGAFEAVSRQVTDPKTQCKPIFGCVFNESGTKLSDPRHSRGFISVSPSKGQEREAPEGAHLTLQA